MVSQFIMPAVTVATHGNLGGSLVISMFTNPAVWVAIGIPLLIVSWYVLNGIGKRYGLSTGPAPSEEPSCREYRIKVCREDDS